MFSDSPSSPPVLPLAVVAEGGFATLVSDAGEIETMPVGEAALRLAEQPALVCHARLTGLRLGAERLQALDVLELFAFTRPGQFCVPTVRGLCAALALAEPHDSESAALALWPITTALLDELADLPPVQGHTAAGIAATMGRGGWRWAGMVLDALGRPSHETDAPKALAAWQLLPEWEESEPPDAPTTRPVDMTDARHRLAEIVARTHHAEPRPEQSDYAGAVSEAFAAPTSPDAPIMVLAEAGTGVGKTLGYLAPASLWAEQNQAPVWISTYTRNLQRQIEQETAHIYPDPKVRAEKVVVRKGRENYLCLLNFEEAIRASFAAPQFLVPLGLVARWLAVTKDGDIRGGDLPGWLPDLMGRNRFFNLADRRGECIHGACSHYKRCFIEQSVRKARGAEIVIANHALVLSACASGGVDEAAPPRRFVFDEGHHVFHAADSAFAADLSGFETADLRRWLLGGEGRAKGRVRGLGKRAEPLLPSGEEGLALLEAIAHKAGFLPGEGWQGRISRREPHGAAEKFLLAVRDVVYARDADVDGPYALECERHDLPPELLELGDALCAKLAEITKDIRRLTALLLERLDKEAATLEGDVRRRIEALCRTLQSYVLDTLLAWQAMLRDLHAETPPEFFDWLQVERIDGQDLDVALSRRWRDPSKPFAIALSRQAEGVLVTSATLTDPTRDVEAAWQAAEADTGAVHLPAKALRAAVPSPFDYAKQTRVLVVTDVSRKDEASLAAAYRELFLASGGGALGLFTAIERLKRVHKTLIAPMAEAELPLYAQHLDGLDPNTLIDIFRAEGNACLLGTDAVRDGVDVPGRALRLIVFDRIPWPRTNLLLKARKETFGGSVYVERLTRQRLRQAFGRLIRRATDTGVFVLLDPLPSRLASAFPGVVPERVTLAEAVAITRGFLHESEAELTEMAD